MLAPVLLRHLPPLGRLGHLPVEAPTLLFLVDVQPELQEHEPAVHECRFKVVDLAVGAAPEPLGDFLLDAIAQHARVPAPIENGDLARGRHALPEAPQERASTLVLGWGAVREDAEAARIEGLDQRADGCALARGVPAFEDEQGGHARAAQVAL